MDGNCSLGSEHGQLAACPSTSKGGASKLFLRMMLAHGAYQIDSASERINLGQDQSKKIPIDQTLVSLAGQRDSRLIPPRSCPTNGSTSLHVGVPAVSMAKNGSHWKPVEDSPKLAALGGRGLRPPVYRKGV